MNTGIVVTSRDAYLPSRSSEIVGHLNEWYDSDIDTFANTLAKYTNVEGS